jgi:hypothetical protein
MTATNETIAQEILDCYSDFGRILDVADRLAIDADQDWENHQTIFKFKDGSQLKAKFPELTIL